MNPDTPPPLALVLLILLRRAGWNQQMLAAKLRVKEETVSGWIKKGLKRKRLDEAVLAIGFELTEIGRTLDYLEGRDPDDAEEIPGYADLTPEERRIVREVRTRTVQAALAAVDAELPRALEEARHRQARARAERQWQKLKTLPPERQRRRIEKNRDRLTPALVARVCEESEKAASDSAGRALALAELALFIAERVPGEVSHRAQAYAHGLITNAHRVGGQLPVADTTYARALEMWKAGSTGDPAIDGARFLDFGASLRRDQRRLDEAIAFLDEALELATPTGMSDLLLNKSHIQHARGEYEEALQTLDQAAARIDPEREPWSWFAVQFNRAANLTRLGEYQKAQRLLPTIWDLVDVVKGDLHLLKVRWLAAEITAGLGDEETATRSLAAVRKEFADRKDPFNTALVSLDIAEIYLKQDRWPEVHVLANEMTQLFRDLGVHREALTAALLFREATERKEATVDLVRRLARYLREARADPSLHFEG